MHCLTCHGLILILLFALSSCASAPMRVRHAVGTYAAVLPGVTLTVTVHEPGFQKSARQQFRGSSAKGRAVLAFLQKPGRPWHRSLTNYAPAIVIHDGRALELNLSGATAILNIHDYGQYVTRITPEESAALMRQIWDA